MKKIVAFVFLIVVINSCYSQSVDAPIEVKNKLLGMWGVGADIQIVITFYGDFTYSKTISRWDPNANKTIRKVYTGKWNIKLNDNSGEYIFIDSSPAKGDYYEKGQTIFIEFQYEKGKLKWFSLFDINHNELCGYTKG